MAIDANNRRSCPIPTASLPKNDSAALLSLKTLIQELALTSPIRQLFAPISAEGGIRLPRYRIMWQHARFAQAHWVPSIESIESDTMSLALVEKCRNCHLPSRPKQVCELRVGLCPVITRVNGTDGMWKRRVSLTPSGTRD